jgi:hypothetical protein
MFQGIRLDELTFVQFDGYNLHPFVGDAPHLKPSSDKKAVSSEVISAGIEERL